jgi:hypothetical protein
LKLCCPGSTRTIGAQKFFAEPLVSNMNVDATVLYVLAIVFIATLICPAFGFGEVLVTVPLLVFRIPLPVDHFVLHIP